LSTISAVVPVKNGARFIEPALASLLGQGPVVSQIIVVDDGSTDDTAAVVRAIADQRIRLVPNAGPPGVSGGRNTGAALVEEGWLYFLDGDDLVRPGALLALLQAAEAHPEAGVVFGDYRRIDEAGRPVGRRSALKHLRAKPSGEVLAAALLGNFMVVGAQIIRREVFRAAGGFDASIRYGEDWNAWCRIAALTPFHHAKGLEVMDYRLHGSSAVHRRVLTLSDFKPGIDAVFSDPLVRRRMEGVDLERLRAGAEAHMLGYIATEAVRMRRFWTAARATGQAIRRSPRLAPRTLVRVGGALAGL